jgi:predicted esterase
MKTLIVFLHGSGSNGRDISTFLHYVPLPNYNFQSFMAASKAMDIDVVTPTSPIIPYTPAMGTNMHVWFDRSSDFLRKGRDDIEDTSGVESSISNMLTLIHSEARAYDHVFFGGFSMGGGLALHSVRKDVPQNVCGIFSMGSFLTERSSVFSEPLNSGGKLPILMMHGRDDDMIDISWGRQTASSLHLKDIDVTFQEYDGVGHEMGEDELSDLLDWIKDIKLQKNREGTREGIEDKYNSMVGDLEGVEIGADTKPAGMTGEIAASTTNEGSANTQCLSTQQQTLSPTDPKFSNLVFSSPGSLPFAMEVTSSSSAGSSTDHRVYFKIPSNMISTATSRPVLVAGGTFELREHHATSPEEVDVVYVDVTSPSPALLAEQIAVRLAKRFGDGPVPINPCPMS